ncbi:hypothetical protein CYANOKiyG1_72850 [Okeania sp. KiyG1]|nr:hypothetical protein CYANOKiyG1_72850 [Okeania sp. KiyG1]
MEAEKVAQLYQVKPDKRLKGKEATPVKYRELLQQVKRVLSSHHAVSRIDDNLESALILADEQKITLGELLTPAYRFPELDEVFLSCCETNVGVAKPTDDILTLNTGFLSAGAQGVISTLWEVDDLAACVFSIIYHELRAEGIDRVVAVQKAQQTIRNMTKKQLKQEYKKSLEEMLEPKLRAASKLVRALETQKSSYVEGSPEYKSWQKKLEKAINDYNGVTKDKINLESRLQNAYKLKYPFAHPVYWSSFICAGLRD